MEPTKVWSILHNASAKVKQKKALLQNAQCNGYQKAKKGLVVLQPTMDWCCYNQKRFGGVTANNLLVVLQQPTMVW